MDAGLAGSRYEVSYSTRASRPVSIADAVTTGRWPVTTTVGRVTASAVATRLPTTVTVGSKATAWVWAAWRGATISDPTAMVPAARRLKVRTAEKRLSAMMGSLVN